MMTGQGTTLGDLLRELVLAGAQVVVIMSLAGIAMLLLELLIGGKD